MSDEFYPMPHQRFYEKNPTVKQAVEMLFKFPPDIKTLLSRGLCVIAEKEYNTHLLVSDFKSLGKDKILALYKSESRQRDYDTDPHVHKAMNYLMILEAPDQWFLASRLLEMIDITRDYLTLCKERLLTPHLNTIERLINTYVAYGAQEALELLDQIRDTLAHIFQKITALQESLPLSQIREQAIWESIANKGAGLGIRGDINPLLN